LNRIILVTVVLSLALVFAASAEASSVNTLIVADSVSVNTADDASAEYISNGGTTSNDYDNTRIISVGDVIRGAFNISRINNSTTNVGINGVNEWSGAFSIKVKSITEIDASGTNDGDITEQDWTIVFEADDNFDDWLNAVWSGKGASMASGTAIRMWEDTTPNFDVQAVDGEANEENADAFVMTAMDGDWYWDLGFGSNGGTWISTNSALIAPAGTTAALATSPANFELSLLGSGANAVGIKKGALVGPFGNNVDFGGNTSIFGAGANNSGTQNEETAGFHARDKATFQFIAVPVPQAVWLGLALMGVIGVGSARRRKAA
jgi:hypothetical protein